MPPANISEAVDTDKIPLKAKAKPGSPAVKTHSRTVEDKASATRTSENRDALPAADLQPANISEAVDTGKIPLKAKAKPGSPAVKTHSRTVEDKASATRTSKNRDALPATDLQPATLPETLDAGEQGLGGAIDYANRRVIDLTNRLRNLENTSNARLKEISHLQSTVARLRDQNLHLEGRVSELVRDSEVLRIADNSKAQQIRSLVSSRNRVQNDFFWTMCQFVAGADGFERFANIFGYDVSRLFSFLFTAEIGEAPNLSGEIKRHAIAVANIFDPLFYLTQYSDVALEGVNPLLHYVTRGSHDMRAPTLLFDPAYYVSKAKLGSGDPLLHYVQKGALEGLKPHPLFDGKYYSEQYPEVGRHRFNPLFHYQTWGGRECRNPSPLFDTQYFLQSRNLPVPSENPLRDYLIEFVTSPADPHPLFHSSFFCAQAGITEPQEAPLVSYEKRADLHRSLRPHPLFDLNFMQDRLGIAFENDMSPLESFCRLSRDRDIDPTILFDSKLYRYQIETERRGSLNEPPILHYLKRGYQNKTLLPNILFDPKTYIERNNIDISGPELTHYCLEGDRKGFFTHSLFCAETYNEQRTDGEECTALEHCLAAAPGQAHVTHPHTGRALLPELLDFIVRVYADDEEFDANFYRQIYSDLIGLSVEDATNHYYEVGRSEGRVGSPRTLVQKHKLLIRQLPLGFFPDEYLQLNPDLIAAGLPHEFLPLFGHYIQSGLKENRTIGRWQFYMDMDELGLRVPTPASPLAVDVDVPRIDVCMLMHLFYPDLWPELVSFASNFESVSRDIFVNVVDAAWSPHFHRQLRELCPGAFAQLSNNTGRDIGAFMRLLDDCPLKAEALGVAKGIYFVHHYQGFVSG